VPAKQTLQGHGSELFSQRIPGIYCSILEKIYFSRQTGALLSLDCHVELLDLKETFEFFIFNRLFITPVMLVLPWERRMPPST